MSGGNVVLTRVPVHAELHCVARFAAEADSEAPDDDESVPLAVLDLDRYPRAAALLGSYLEGCPEGAFVAVAEPWCPLPGDDLDAYDRAHVHHPLLQFLVTPEIESDSPIEALSFRVCVVCEAGFMQHVTALEHMGVVGALPDECNPDSEDVLPEILPVSIDPGAIGHAELRTWRLHYAR